MSNEETTNEPNETNEEELVSKSGTVRDVFKELSRLSMDDDNTNVIVLPCGKGSALEKLINYVNDSLADNELKSNSVERNVAIGLNTTSYGKAYPEDALYDKVNEDSESMVNHVEYAGKELGVRKVSVNASGKLSGGNALAKFNTALGLGRYVTVTLWHSGFSLTLRPPKETDIINLHSAVANTERKLGLETSLWIMWYRRL